MVILNVSGLIKTHLVGAAAVLSLYDHKITGTAYIVFGGRLNLTVTKMYAELFFRDFHLVSLSSLHCLPKQRT